MELTIDINLILKYYFANLNLILCQYSFRVIPTPANAPITTAINAVKLPGSI